MKEVKRMREEKPYYIKTVDTIEKADRYAQVCVKNATSHIKALVFKNENGSARIELYRTYIYMA